MNQLLKTVAKVMERMTEMVETIRPKSQAVNILISALLVLYMAGLMIFHAVGNFDYDPAWDHAYWLWDLVKDLLFWIILLSLKREFSLVVLLIIFYAIIRLCWEIATIILETGPNVWFVVDSLFLVLLVIIAFLTLNQRS